MTRTRLFALRMAGLMAALAVPLAMVIPVAQADTIADIRGTVARDRANSGCPDMKYNQTLQDIAFAQARLHSRAGPPRSTGLKAAYDGAVTTVAVGDG